MLKERDLTVSEISEAFDMSTPSISYHLDLLKHAQLVSARKNGQFVTYSLETTVLDESLGWLLESNSGTGANALEYSRGNRRMVHENDRNVTVTAGCSWDHHTLPHRVLTGSQIAQKPAKDRSHEQDSADLGSSIRRFFSMRFLRFNSSSHWVTKSLPHE